MSKIASVLPLLVLLGSSACAGSAPSSAPPAASSTLAPLTVAGSGIDSPALADPPPTASAQSGGPGTNIRRVPCNDTEASSTCSERAQREVQASLPSSAQIVGVSVLEDVSTYRAELEIDGVVQKMDASSTDEIARQTKELQDGGHRVVVRSVDAAPGAKHGRHALVLLKTSP